MAKTGPNLFILGPPRTGTTSLARWLSLHPDVAAGRRKEPMYHAPDLPSPRNVTSLEEYLALWAGGRAGRLNLDSSVWYLYSDRAAHSIAEMSPDARFIVHLRNPVDLLASLHAHHLFLGLEDQPDFETAIFTQRDPDPTEFRRAIDYLRLVRLAPQLERFFEHFPPQRFTFVDFAALTADPEPTYLGVLAGLKLDALTLPRYAHLNPGRHQRLAGANQRFSARGGAAGRAIGKVVRRLNTVPRDRSVDPEIRRRILERIQPDIDDLATLIDRDLTDWLAS